MFSGLTNQVSSWMGSTKTETHDEEVLAAGGAPGSATAAARTEEENLLGTATALPLQQTENVEVPLENLGEDGDKKQSPTKAGGLFSGVKSQMTGWLGNASIPSMPAMPAMPSMPSIPHIPGLRKHNAENEAEGGVKSPSGEAAQQPLGDSDPAHGDDEDKSSATEGADSGPSSPQPGTPTEEQAGQIGNVTTKVTQSAKTFGSFLYSAVNKAGAKIKKTVEDAHILGEFNKEQEAFMKSQTGKTDAAVPPWIGHKNESSVKDEILTLSSDRRNFVRAPPAGVEFEFSYDVSYSVALAIMAEDPALEKMRFELVPKIITEENFWRNYFYRVSLICQAGDLGTLGEDSLASGSNEDGDDKEPKKDADEIVVKSENLEQEASNPSDSSTGNVDVKANDNIGEGTVKNTSNVNNNNNKNNNINKNKKNNSKKIQSASNSNKQRSNESEFVSDTFQTTESDLKEVEDGMRILGIDTLAKQALENDKYMDEQWEKDLEAELQEYEMVVDDKQDINWEADVDELLNDTTDLK